MSEKKIINGGDVLVKCLLEEDVKYIFGITGGQLLRMYDAVYRWGREQGIQTIMFRHEQAAAHAADAYARVTNKPGVCCGTVGPGATHLVPGVGTAWSDNIPVIAIVPQVLSRYEDSFFLQGNLDQISLFKPITKYQKSVRKVKDIPDAVQKIFREATGGRPGPVLLEIFEDAFNEEIEEEKLRILTADQYRSYGKPAVDKESIKKALDLLLTAEKPLIVSGGGVARAEAWNELQEFAEYLQIPVITSLMGIGTISNESNCHLGATLIGAGLQTAMQIMQTDVILALGCKFSFIMGQGSEPFWNDSQKLIQVDIDPTIIGRAKPITIGIVSDCKIFLKQILEEVKKTNKIEKRDWLETLVEARENNSKSIKKKASRDRIPIKAERMVKEVLEFMDEDAILIIDGGNITVSALQQLNLYKTRPPLSHLESACMGQLGTSVPYGIGAKLAKPNKQVISISGDGSFMINFQDLETCVRLGLKNLIYVIANNGCWGMIKTGQEYIYNKRYIDTDMGEFDYGKAAEAFGCHGETISDPNEIKPALERAKNSGKPAVIDVKIKHETPDIMKLMARSPDTTL